MCRLSIPLLCLSERMLQKTGWKIVSGFFSWLQFLRIGFYESSDCPARVSGCDQVLISHFYLNPFVRKNRLSQIFGIQINRRIGKVGNIV